MARNRKKQNESKDERYWGLMIHARAMNFRTLDEYQEWCRQEGFSTNLNKSSVVRNRESTHYKALCAMQRLRLRKKKGNLSCLIEEIYSGKVTRDEPGTENQLAIKNGFCCVKNKRLLRDVLMQLDEKTKLLNFEEYIKGIVGFVQYYGKWVRPITEWKPKTHNARRQFASLARHLFADYSIPEFMDSVWHNDKQTEKEWFIHVGLGNNIRTARCLPVKLTKKMAHCFLQAPDAYDVKSAFRWAQIHALGGNKRIVDAVVETKLARKFKDNEFWESVFRFFIDNPMLDTSQYNPIVDYIWNQKYETRMVFVERGVARREGPAQPNFTMRGRTPETLLRQVDDWHRELGKERRGGDYQWVKSRFADYQYIEGSEKSKNMRIWSITELLNSKELIAEGRELHHCVATYAHACMSRTTSIWTMAVQGSDEQKKQLTIELHNRTGSIRQIRGLRNRLATKHEMSVIQLWATTPGLKLATYIG